MEKNKAKIGTKIKSLRDFSGVPKGTEGIIDEDYGKGVMVAWDLPDRPLHGSNPRGFPVKPLRDGFDKETELQFLEEI